MLLSLKEDSGKYGTCRSEVRDSRCMPLPLPSAAEKKRRGNKGQEGEEDRMELAEVGRRDEKAQEKKSEREEMGQGLDSGVNKSYIFIKLR